MFLFTHKDRVLTPRDFTNAKNQSLEPNQPVVFIAYSPTSRVAEALKREKIDVYQRCKPVVKDPYFEVQQGGA